jgi:23S rRNA pseudouridine1911/1915/1917 synthase
MNLSSISILTETPDALFINKPAGISVHGDGKTPEYTVADWVLETYPALAEVGESFEIEYKGQQIVIAKPGIVHRLDKDTSGVMLIAKTQEAYLFFKSQFQDRNVKKIYHAFVYGWLKEDEQTIDLAIGRSTTDIRRYSTERGARGTLREAQTIVRALWRFGSREYVGKGSTDEGTYTLVEAEPKTGRTHQIRVHLRAINHPIVADSLYAPKRPHTLKFERLALHARSLSIATPSGETVTVEAPYPQDFAETLTGRP